MLTELRLAQIEDLNLAIRTSIQGSKGHTVPRVTSVIDKMIHEDSICEWANHLGFQHKSYSKTLKEYADLGSKVHKGIEHYLKNNTVSEIIPMHFLNSFLAWWTKLIANNKINVLGQEERLVCDYFSGAYDLLLEINGKPYLVDFKTSSFIQYKYYLQLAAYRHLLRVNKQIEPAGFIILQLHRDKPTFTEYFLNLEQPAPRQYIDTCERTFFALVYGYYHIHWLEREFKNVVTKTPGPEYTGVFDSVRELPEKVQQSEG